MQAMPSPISKCKMENVRELNESMIEKRSKRNVSVEQKESKNDWDIPLQIIRLPYQMSLKGKKVGNRENIKCIYKEI